MTNTFPTKEQFEAAGVCIQCTALGHPADCTHSCHAQPVSQVCGVRFQEREDGHLGDWTTCLNDRPCPVHKIAMAKEDIELLNLIDPEHPFTVLMEAPEESPKPQPAPVGGWMVETIRARFCSRCGTNL